MRSDRVTDQCVHWRIPEVLSRFVATTANDETGRECRIRYYLLWTPCSAERERSAVQ